MKNEAAYKEISRCSWCAAIVGVVINMFVLAAIWAFEEIYVLCFYDLIKIKCCLFKAFFVLILVRSVL